MAPAPVTAAAHQPPDLEVLGDPTTMRDVLSRWDEVVRARADHPAFVDRVVGAVSFAAGEVVHGCDVAALQPHLWPDCSFTN